MHRNRAIELLKKEIEVMEGEKGMLAQKVSDLEARRLQLEETLKVVKESEALALDRKKKVVESCKSLRDELETEKKATEVYKTKVDDLCKELDRARALAAEVAEGFSSEVRQCGGVIEPPRPSLSAVGLLGWIKKIF